MRKLRHRSLNGISKVTHIIVVDPRFEPNQHLNLVPESMVLTIMLHYTVYSRNNHQEMEIAKKIICNVKGNYKFIMCRLNEKYIDPM